MTARDVWLLLMTLGLMAAGLGIAHIARRHIDEEVESARLLTEAEHLARQRAIRAQCFEDGGRPVPGFGNEVVCLRRENILWNRPTE